MRLLFVHAGGYIWGTYVFRSGVAFGLTMGTRIHKANRCANNIMRVSPVVHAIDDCYVAFPDRKQEVVIIPR